MLDETNAYAVKINGITFVSMDAAKDIVDKARKDAWDMALEEAEEICRKRQGCGKGAQSCAAAIRKLKEKT